MNNSISAPRKLFTGHLRYLEENLPESVRALKQDDPLREVWVVVPNQLARLHLQRYLAQNMGIAANVRFKTVTDLMHTLAEPVIMREGWSTLSESASDPLLAHIISGTINRLTYLEPVAGTAGFRRALLRTRRDLILHDIVPADLNRVPLRERERAAKVRDLILLLSAIEQELARQRLHDGASLQLLARQALRESESVNVPIVLYALYELPPLTRTIMHQVVSRVPAIAFLPWIEGRPPYAHADTMQRWYRENAFEIVTEEEPVVKYAPIRLVSAPKEPAIATEIIRDILYTDEINAGDAAVLLPGSGDTLSDVLEMRCLQTGLYPYVYQAKSLGHTAAGRGLAAFVELLDGKFTREQVCEYLAAAPFLQPVASMTSEWVRLAEESLVVAGAKEWTERVERKLGQLEYRAVKLTEMDEEDTALQTLKRRIENGKACNEFVTKLSEKVQEIRSCKSWELAVSVLWEFYRLQIEMDEAFADLTRQLEQASVLDSANVPCTPSGVREFILSALETPGTRIGVFGSGTPLVAPREQCLGATFNHIFLPGFNEGTLPHTQRQDPLLLDGDRALVNETLATALPLAADSLVRERYLLELQLRAAGKRITLYISRSDADGRPQLKSPYVSELISVQRGEIDSTSELDDFIRTEPNREVLSHPLEAFPNVLPVSVGEFNRGKLNQALQSGSIDPLRHLTSDKVFTSAVHAEHSRFSTKSFASFDGIISDPEALNDLQRRFSPEQSLSATTLENYWKCPFRFMVSKLWDAYAPEELNNLTPVTEREKGIILHDILQRYHGARLNKLIRAEHYPWEDLQNTAYKVIADYARKFPVGSRYAAEKLKREILQTLSRYHAALFEEGGSWKTKYVEVSFGYGAEPFPEPVEYVSTDNTAVRFKGRVDRWDSDETGSQIVITDYKSGREPNKSSRGFARRLQLSVYHLLAEAGNRDATVKSLYYYIKINTASESKDDEARTRELVAATTLASDMRAGIFAPDPSEDDPTACKHCSVKLACGPQRHARKPLNTSTIAGLKTDRPSADEDVEFEDHDHD